MKRLTMSVLTVLMAFAFGGIGPQTASARIQYFNEFKKKYDKIEGVEDHKCGICHGGNKGANKKKVSEYGKALGEALGGKNVKGEDKIGEALDKIESKDAGEGKTYGDLLKDGKLPPAFKE